MKKKVLKNKGGRQQNLLLYALVCLLSVPMACEKEFVPEISGDPDSIVVEGYIEGGAQATPPYVILTRSFPFSQALSADQLSSLFIHDAEVQVSDGDREVLLTELCLQDLTPEQRELAGNFLGFDTDSLGFDFCVYIDLSAAMVGTVGKTYELSVTVADETLRASTTIPDFIPLDSLQFVAPPGEPVDTLAQLLCYINDPGGEPNFYRYFTQVNDGPLQPPLSSVTDDLFFDGQAFEFPLSKAERDTAFDLATFGLFHRGDTVTIKWACLDQAHFDFWNTLEFNRANQGPFSSYTRIQSNVSGGLGIWGGLSADYYTLLVPEE